MLDVYFALTKARNKVDSLREINIAIIVSVNEEHRRFPGVHGSNGRRIVRELGQLRRNIFSVPIIRGPIVHTVHIHAGGEEV